MLRDFKPLIKEENTDAASIETLFRKGEVAEALSACRRTGRNFDQFSGAMEKGLRKMFQAGRANEILSLNYKHKLTCNYDIPTLLRAVLDKGDFPGFLKQAFRFQVYQGFEAEIERSLEWLVHRKQHATAEAYRLKFAQLTEGSKA
jgi:hypothetical protein